MQQNTIAGGRSALFSPTPQNPNVVFDMVSAEDSPKTAKRNVALLMSKPMLRCLRRGTVAQVRASDPAAKVTNRLRILNVPKLGDGAAGLIHTTTIVDSGGQRTYVDQIEFIQVGPVVATLHVSTRSTVNWTLLRESLARLVARRLKLAQSLLPT
jgi:hypothetical protein